MNLHNNKKDFYDTILAVASKYKTSPAIIEKDYYVTMFLQALAEKVPTLLFKGGTSLSKCNKIINRFSEDIDLTLDANYQSQGNKRNLKNQIIDVCNELGFQIMNIEDIRSRRDYNKYEIKYPMQFELTSIKQYILVETVFMVKAYPYEVKEASSMIYDFLNEINDQDIILKYDMMPFNINVQTLERTLIDKVFALCDYAVSNNIDGYSRHIYDIKKVLEKVVLDDEFKSLVDVVRNERKKHERCYTADDKFSIPSILRNIVDNKIYYNDYENVTKKILFEEMNYETAIVAIEQIIESEVFEK